jgi:hypothetical protein
MSLLQKFIDDACAEFTRTTLGNGIELPSGRQMGELARNLTDAVGVQVIVVPVLVLVVGGQRCLVEAYSLIARSDDEFRAARARVALLRSDRG